MGTSARRQAHETRVNMVYLASSISVRAASEQSNGSIESTKERKRVNKHVCVRACFGACVHMCECVFNSLQAWCMVRVRRA